MNIAIIPARGGSRRIPRKNIRDFHGQPIIVYSIEAALESNLFHRVVVSTDDPETAKIALINGAMVHERSPEFARDEVGTQAVARHVLSALGDADGMACCIYATAPMLESRTLQRASFLLAQLFADYVVPVATWLADPGQFYMGRAGAFLAGVPLIGPKTIMCPIDEETAIDINTETDWQTAEAMYAALHPEVCA